MNIRLLHEEDWIIWKAFRRQTLIAFPLAFSSSLEEEKKLADQQFKEWIKRHTIYGAFIEGHMIGSVGFFKLECSKERHRGVLFGMNVFPTYQRRGIGGELMETIIRHAKNYVSQLHLTVVSSNETAVRLYQRHGFHIYGTEPRSLKVDNCFYDHHLMALFYDQNSKKNLSVSALIS